MALKVDRNWTLFLDRDGVINKRNFGGYITSIKEFHFLPNALKGISQLSKMVGKIIVVTNQQCIGKKILKVSNLNEIHDYMVKEVDLAGGRIDAVLFAPNLKSAENNRRKPDSCMALEAREMFPEVDFNKSIMVGDTDTDIQFGTNLGMKTVLIRSEEKITEKADFELNDLIELVELIKY